MWELLIIVFFSSALAPMGTLVIDRTETYSTKTECKNMGDLLAPPDGTVITVTNGVQKFPARVLAHKIICQEEGEDA